MINETEKKNNSHRGGSRRSRRRPGSSYSAHSAPLSLTGARARRQLGRPRNLRKKMRREKGVSKWMERDSNKHRCADDLARQPIDQDGFVL